MADVVAVIGLPIVSVTLRVFCCRHPSNMSAKGFLTSSCDFHVRTGRATKRHAPRSCALAFLTIAICARLAAKTAGAASVEPASTNVAMARRAIRDLVIVVLHL